MQLRKIGKISLVGLLILIALITVFLSACDESQVSQRRKSIELRAQMFERAEAKVPVPYTENFPMRELLVEYTRRGDMLNHPWYTYIISDTGAITAYFVSTTLPVSTSAFLSSTEDQFGDNVLTAPSLDGIYYGGGGSTTSNSGWIFIDAATGAMGVIYGCNIITFDAPLMLQQEPMLIQARQRE